MYLTEGTIEFKVSLYRFLIALLLGGNTGLLGILIRFIWKFYRKYKNAIMVYIEEHEKLVQDYIQRHPEEVNASLSVFAKVPRKRILRIDEDEE
jgi:hypothetical protein